VSGPLTRSRTQLPVLRGSGQRWGLDFDRDRQQWIFRWSRFRLKVAYDTGPAALQSTFHWRWSCEEAGAPPTVVQFARSRVLAMRHAEEELVSRLTELELLAVFTENNDRR
jgi:hypothetical protein